MGLLPPIGFVGFVIAVDEKLDVEIAPSRLGADEEIVARASSRSRSPNRVATVPASSSKNWLKPAT